MLIVMDSKKSFADTCAAMEPTVQKHKFGVLSVHNLRETMARKGVTFERECSIYEVCNPVQAKKVLDSRMEVSTALPCRISVYQEGGRVKVATIKPTVMLMTFNAPELAPVAREVEEAITSIMKEVAE
jgi:uncharacterized protein (DUF302 family)